MHIIVYFPKWEKKQSDVCQYAKGNYLMYKEQQALVSPVCSRIFAICTKSGASEVECRPPLPEGAVQTCQALAVVQWGDLMKNQLQREVVELKQLYFLVPLYNPAAA